MARVIIEFVCLSFTSGGAVPPNDLKKSPTGPGQLGQDQAAHERFSGNAFGWIRAADPFLTYGNLRPPRPPRPTTVHPGPSWPTVVSCPSVRVRSWAL